MRSFDIKIWSIKSVVNEEELFNKFWNVIIPPVFIEMLMNSFDNGHIEQHDDDEFDDYYEADFDEVYDMYGDDIELEHSNCCICRIPEDWLPKCFHLTS